MSTAAADLKASASAATNAVKPTQEQSATDLENAVQRSNEHADVQDSIHAHAEPTKKHDWFRKLIPQAEKLATYLHAGNDVIDRATGKKIWESMPIYARIGMHLLFYGANQVEVLENWKGIQNLLKEQSVKQGVIFDSPESVKNIPSFIKTYDIQTAELLHPDISSYKNFNEFFYRQLKPDARPVENLDNPNGFCSAADCRLTVYNSVTLAQKFWIKGDEFTIPNLLKVAPDSPEAKTFHESSLAIFRLAPADYHRFHSPLDCVVGDKFHVDGNYYTVNPQAVNEPRFDVFSANTRTILYLTHKQTGQQVAFVAVGALLVGSIKWTGGENKGNTVKRGEELGYFAYGGSTVIALFPKGLIEFDADLVKNSQSEKPIETLMKVGYSLGHVAAGAPTAGEAPKVVEGADEHTSGV